MKNVSSGKRTPKKAVASSKTTASKKVSGSATPKKGASPVHSPLKKGLPTFVVMICEAIADLEGTVSRTAIIKWIKDHYTVNEPTFANHIKNGFLKAEEEGKIIKVKGSFKLKAPSEWKAEAGPKLQEASKKAVATVAKATKRKAATPKRKTPIKKQRKEEEAEIGEDDEDAGSQEIDSQKGTADEDSVVVSDLDTDFGDITENVKAECDETEEKAEKDSSAKTVGDEAEEAQTNVVAPENPKVNTAVNETVERSGEGSFAPVGSEAPEDVKIVSEFRGKVPDDGKKAAEVVEVNDEPLVIAKEPQVVEVESPQDQGLSSSSGHEELAAEASEEDADLPVDTSIPVVHEAENDVWKSALNPTVSDPMAVEPA